MKVLGQTNLTMKFHTYTAVTFEVRRPLATEQNRTVPFCGQWSRKSRFPGAFEAVFDFLFTIAVVTQLSYVVKKNALLSEKNIFASYRSVLWPMVANVTFPVCVSGCV